MTPADVVAAALGLAGAAAIIYGPWQSACVDYYRQPLFEQRDRLFEMAKSGQISFDDPAYRASREMINRLIRYAHLVSFPRFVGHTLIGLVDQTAANKFSRIIDGASSPEVRDSLSDITRICMVSMARLMIAKSPLVWLIGVVGLVAYFGSKPFVSSASIVRRISSSLMNRLFGDAEITDHMALPA